jgi:peptidoglycan/xylan/chitin deacetylase (PgdA/CDA1 family)
MLSALPVEVQREEIVRSRADVEALVGRPATTFSYPHGRYDARTAQLVRAAGFSVAGTVAPAPGPFDCGRAGGDELHVRRVPVLDWDGETFLRKLRAGFDD